MYLSKLLNVFVQIAKCICPNYKFSYYLFWICFLLFRSFWMRNVCPKFSIFVDAISQCNAIFTAIFSFCFDSHSFRKSPRSDTLIQRTKNTYTWQMTQVPLKGKKCSHQLHTQSQSQMFKQSIGVWLSLKVPAHLSWRLVNWFQFIPDWLVFCLIQCKIMQCKKRQKRATRLNDWRTVLNADQLLPNFLTRASILEHPLRKRVIICVSA